MTQWCSCGACPGIRCTRPLTDATIGMFVLAAGLAIIGKAGGIQLAAAKGMWLALIGGAVGTAAMSER